MSVFSKICIENPPLVDKTVALADAAAVQRFKLFQEVRNGRY